MRVRATVLTALALAACGDGGENAPEPGRGDPTDAAIARFLADTLPEGASGTLVAARDGELVHCRGFGMADREAGLGATCDTVYDVGSITKQFTGAAIVKLEMMGKLRVTDRIGRHLGPVPADKRAITLHQLLTHTSGLVEGLGDDYQRLSRRKLVRRALKSRLRSPPGVEFRYSNAGYSLLAAIVEKASGMGYEEFLARRLFAPAGMTQTGYVLPRWRGDRVAVEYDPRGRPQGRPFEHPWADDGPYWNLRGNGGMLSTARDMFRWHVALQGREILDRRAKRKLFKPHVREEHGGEIHYGYGWVIHRADAGTVAWHNGGNGWSYAELARVLDDGAMVFWVTNRYRDAAARWNLEQLGGRLTEGVAERLLDGN